MIKNSAKKIKIPLIILSIILVLIIAITIASAIFYFNVDALRFDHVDTAGKCAANSYNLSEEEMKAQGYYIKTPFFGNSVMIGETGGYNLYFMEPGVKNIPVYDAVNSPIDAWSSYIVSRYNNQIKVDYDLIQDDKSITVTMNGFAVEDGKNIPINEKFVFNIENASPENLPQWVNENEIDADYKEFMDYLHNPDNAAMPDWISERRNEQ